MVRCAPFADHARAAISAATVRFPPEKCTGVMRLVRPRDVTARLGELDLPVLVTSGGHEKMTPAVVQPLVDGIRGVEAAVFEQAAHLAMAEEPDRYRELVESFLSRVEAAATRLRPAPVPLATRSPQQK